MAKKTRALAEELQDEMTSFEPIKRQIRINQFDWTEKQKDFFKIALHRDTKIVFVDGPAGTSKTLLAVYCGLQLLNMKCISDMMYLRSSVEASDQRMGFYRETWMTSWRTLKFPFWRN